MVLWTGEDARRSIGEILSGDSAHNFFDSVLAQTTFTLV
jgi:hypothetical protein